MYRKSMFSLLVLFCTILLSACSTSTAPSIATSTAAAATDRNSSPSTPSVDSTNVSKVNLNTGSANEFLAAVPGLGDRMVREFMEYRPYISIQQFRQEIGKYVDQAQVAEYEKYVYVPIAINDSDAETLQQIPGLSPEEAQALMTARPFASSDEFLIQLSQYVSADEVEIARTYLGGE